MSDSQRKSKMPVRDDPCRASLRVIGTARHGGKAGGERGSYSLRQARAAVAGRAARPRHPLPSGKTTCARTVRL